MQYIGISIRNKAILADYLHNANNPPTSSSDSKTCPGHISRYLTRQHFEIMRVLFVTPFFEPAWSYGGMARTASEWAHAVAEHPSIELHVFTTSANIVSELNVPTGTPVPIGNLHVTYFKRYRWTGKRYVSFQKLVSLIKHVQSYDMVHIVGLWTFGNMMGRWLCIRYNIPYVVSLHGLLMPWAICYHGIRKRIFLSLVERNTLRKANGIICSSEFEKFNLVNLNIVSEDKITVIPNITRSAQFDIEKSRLRFRTKHNLNDAKALIFSGRLVENKGLHLSISAFAKIIGEYPNANFFIAGPEEDKSFEKLKRLIKKLKIPDKVHYLGMLSGETYWDALAGSDLLVLNSYSENFGSVVTEALSVGTPVLISDQVGVKDLVTKYDAGMVTTLEINEIAEAMRSLLADSERLKEMGQRGIELVNENCTNVVVGKQFAEYIEKIVFESKLQ